MKNKRYEDFSPQEVLDRLIQACKEQWLDMEASARVNAEDSSYSSASEVNRLSLNQEFLTKKMGKFRQMKKEIKDGSLKI